MLNSYGTPSTNTVNAPPAFSGRQSWVGQLSTLLGFELWDHSFGGSGLNGGSEAGGTSPGLVPPTRTNYLYKSNGIAKNDLTFSMVIVEATNNGNNPSALAALLTQIKSDQPTATIFVLGALYCPTQAQCTNANASMQSGMISGATFINTNGWFFSDTGFSHPDLAGSTTIANSYLYPILAPYFQTTKLPLVRSGSGGIPLTRGSGIPTTR